MDHTRVRATFATGLASLASLFSSVNNIGGGYERVLARRSKEFRPGRNYNKTFPHMSGCGPQECARRVRQMKRNAVRQQARNQLWSTL